MIGTINDLIAIHYAHADFKIADDQEHSTDSDIRYYGYLNRAREWYIMQRDRSPSGVTKNAYRFVKGGSGYAAAWAGREGLPYDLYDATFG